jgi:prepilin-type N-terminal cleavage/methylation domain-containing protein
MRTRFVPSRTADAGFTLVELLVTVAIMGIAFVVILSGIGVFEHSRTIHRSSAELDRATRTYAERLAGANYDATCPTDYGGVAVPPGFNASVQVKYWDGNATPAGYGATCPPIDRGTQQLTVAMTETSSGQSDQLVFVKRQP